MSYIGICRQLLNRIESGACPTYGHVYVAYICTYLEANFGRLDFMGKRVIGGSCDIADGYDKESDWKHANEIVDTLVEIERLTHERAALDEKIKNLKGGKS